MSQVNLTIAGHGHAAMLHHVYQASEPDALHNIRIGSVESLHNPAYEPFVTIDQTDGGLIFNAAMEEQFAVLAANGKTSAILTTILGTEHYLFSLDEKRRAFDVILPFAPDLPLREGAKLIPYTLLRRLMHQAISPYLAFSARLKKVTGLPVFQIIPPPPISDAALLFENAPEPLKSSMQAHGVPDWAIRLKYWLLWQSIALEIAAEAGIPSIRPPAEALDANGLLRTEYAHNGVIGNVEYGRLVLRQIDDLFEGAGADAGSIEELAERLYAAQAPLHPSAVTLPLAPVHIEMINIDDVAAGTVPSQPGLTVNVDAPARQAGRYVPRIITGRDAELFRIEYDHATADLPWNGLIRIENARVLPDGLLMLEQHSVLLGRGLHQPPEIFPHDCYEPMYRQDEQGFHVPLADMVEHLPGTTATLSCPASGIYGHWLVDVLPRLERLYEHDASIDQYLFDDPITSWQKGMIEAVGVDLDRCTFLALGHVNARCDRVLSRTFEHFNSEVKPSFTRVFDRLRAKFGGPQTDRRINVSRKGWWKPQRQMVNRDEIEEILAQHGFETVYPQYMSFPEQIALFASASVVFGESGSGLHNAAFSGPGTKVGVFQSHNNWNFLQSEMARVAGQEIGYAIGELEEDLPFDAFRLTPEALRELLSAFDL